VVAFWGGVRLDLQDAVLEGPSVDITAWAVMGGVEIRVPDNVVVELDGMVVMGGSDNRTRVPAAPSTGGPLIRVHCRGVWGSVNVRPSKRRDRVKVRAAEMVEHVIDAVVPPELSVAAPKANGTVSILVTDIVGSTAMSERLGDQRWLGVLQSHNALVREQIGRHGGTEVKQMGDGFIVTFDSSRDAVRAAKSIRQAMEGYCVGHPDSPIHLRIAVHAGEVARDGADVFGLNVSTAAHLADVTEPGEVLVSGVVRELAGSTTDLAFGPAREITVSGRTAPLVVHSVLPA
jgi:class 3 adenylate cyclase